MDFKDSIFQLADRVVGLKLSPTGKYLQKTILSYKNAGQVQYKLTK